jgi:hypothetical protein
MSGVAQEEAVEQSAVPAADTDTAAPDSESGELPAFGEEGSPVEGPKADSASSQSAEEADSPPASGDSGGGN